MKIKFNNLCYIAQVLLLSLTLSACSSSSPSPEWFSDSTPPVVTPPDAIVVAAVDDNGALATTVEIAAFLAAAIAIDNLEGQIAVSNNAPAIFPLGVTTITFTARDAVGNIGRATSEITIVDQVAPVLTVPADLVVAAVDNNGLSKSSDEISEFFSAATAVDAIEGAVPVTNNAPETFNLGDTIVIFTATDSVGSSTSGTATVTLVDQSAPVISLSANITVAALDATGTPATQADIALFLSAAQATDNIDGALSVIHNAPGVLPIGVTEVIFSATDKASNTGYATATITVADQNAPVITAPAALTLIALDSNGIAATKPDVVSFLNSVTALDDVVNSVTVSNNAPPVLPVGVTTVEFNAVDTAGNAAITVYTEVTVLLSASTLTRAVEFQSVSTGLSGSHMLAVDVWGLLWSWGDNRRGQLGNGSVMSSTDPSLVPGLTKVSKIAAGLSHSLALLDDGTLWAWGDNSYGQLGIGTITNLPETTAVAVDMTDLPAAAIDISAGENFNLVLLADGSIWAWGYNFNGQLGNLAWSNAAKPVAVVNLTANVIAIAAGANHSMALLNDGTLWAWGYNYNGQLGNGVQGVERTTTPQQVILPQTAIVTAISAGQGHSLSLLSDGTVWSWGNNEFGQLGNSSLIGAAVPEMVVGLPVPASSIGSGSSHNLVIMDNGTVWGWGRNNFRQVNDSTGDSITSPVELVALPVGIANIVCGKEHSLALASDGKVWVWGSNIYGQLGDGVALGTDNAVPTVSIPGGVIELSVGKNHVLATSTGGDVYAWGWNSYGQLGNGATLPVSSPNQLISLNSFNVAAGDDHSLAVLSDGTVWSWGSNWLTQLGDIPLLESHTPINYTGLPTTATQVAAGRAHSLALMTNGKIWAWGDNFSGQLGTGTIDIFVTSGLVAGLPAAEQVTSIDAGDDFSVALMSNGTLWAWGVNLSGQLGVGIFSSFSSTAVAVTGLTGDVEQVAVGGNHSLVLLNDGTVMAWGNNTYGQLGNSGYAAASTAVKVLGLPDPAVMPVTSIAAGTNHSLALLADGSILVWGDNSFGQLGNATSDLSMPLPAILGSSPGAPFKVAAGGETVSMVATLDGSVYAWGDNSGGMLGTQRLLYSSLPRQALPAVGYYVVSKDAVLKTNVILNGYQHPNSGPISLASHDAISANGGIVIYNYDGTFSYTPPVNYVGTDTFVYTVSGENIADLQQVVTINVIQ